MGMDIGSRIAYFRKLRGFSVNYLANQAGVSQSYLREIELGHYGNPTVDILEQLCLAFGITLTEFFNDSKKESDIDDLLLKEIAALNPSQRENLRIFLHSLHTPLCECSLTSKIQK